MPYAKQTADSYIETFIDEICDVQDSKICVRDKNP